MTRRIAVFTSSRADLGPLGPVIAALDAHSGIDLLVIATGTHLLSEYGGRLSDIELSPASRLEVLDAGIASTTPADLGVSYGHIASGLSAILAASPVDILVLLGDRWELLAAAGAALLHGVPIAHLHGGETTEGAIDERIRHSITKLADLHLCATSDSARRIRHLGEELWRIVVTGAPGLDRAVGTEPMPDDAVEALLGRPLVRPFGVVVYHPPTVDRARLAERARTVLDAAAQAFSLALVLYPGADPGAEIVIDEIDRATARHDNLTSARNLGHAYLPLLRAADVLVGNSSSGIIEAASLDLPVVDIGDRQRGRVRSGNVIHATEEADAILAAVETALRPEFRTSVRAAENPYGDGRSSERIVSALLDVQLDRLLHKPLLETRDPTPTVEDMTVGLDATLQKAMEVIDRGRGQIAFVTDGDHRLVGTVTDGDIRRALLRGASLDDGVSQAVARVPVVASPADDDRDLLGLMERAGVKQIPVVDENGRVVGVHLMRAIVREVLEGSGSG